MQPTNLRLNPQLIPELQKPLGLFLKVEEDLPSPQHRVIELLQKEKAQGKLVICIGDFVSKSLIEEKYFPDLIVIDNYTQRTKKSSFKIGLEHKVIEVSNPPGEISKDAWIKIKNELLYLKKNSLNNTKKPLNKDSITKKVMSVIIIKGEEDLLALPMILEAPNGSFVMYGQPPMIGDGSNGIVLIEVTENLKLSVEMLISKFDHI